MLHFKSIASAKQNENGHLVMNPRIAVILTLWKRNNLMKQLHWLARQSVPVTEVWLYHCGQHVGMPLRDRKSVV